MAGGVISHYELQSKLGQGGMAGDAQLDWLSVAVAETLSSDLRKVGVIRVADRQQVIRIAARAASAAESQQTDNGFNSARAAVNRSPKGLGMGYCMVRLLTGLARAFQKLGMGREAREHLQQATDLFRAKETYNFNLVWEGCDAQACYDIARACAVMDKRDLALKWLGEAIAAGWHDRTFLHRDESMISILQTASDEVVALLSDQKANGLTTPEHG